MDQVRGTERFMELRSVRCKSRCLPCYKARGQPSVGERRRSPPSDPQLGAGSGRSQVGAQAGGARTWEVETWDGVQRGCRRSRPEVSALLFRVSLSPTLIPSLPPPPYPPTPPLAPAGSPL